MSKVTTQEQLDAALKKEPNGYFELADAAFHLVLRGAVAPTIIVIGGARIDLSVEAGARVDVTARENSTVTAQENATVTARGNATVTAQGNATVTARENSTVTARENSTVTAQGNATVTARGNATVTAQGNSTVTAQGNSTVTAWGNATVTAQENSTVTAWGNSTVTARENATVTARGFVFVRAHSAKWIDASENCIVAQHGAALISGGVLAERILSCPAPATAQSWCDHYGVEVKDGVALLHKAVGADWMSPHGYSYAPGATPVAHDWDGGKAECGGGLHFSPCPEMAREFFPEATKFLGCPVAITDIAVHADASMPQKVKARGCCAPVFEVDLHGVPMAPADV